jgi:hypothetical protein
MAEYQRVTGSSFNSFAEAAKSAFDEVEGDRSREGIAEARVTELWMTKGGVVGRTQYHAELERVPDGSSPSER